MTAATHRAQDLCRELAAKIVAHVRDAEARGAPSPNAVALLAFASTVAGDFNAQILGAIAEIDTIEGAAGLRISAAAEIRRVAEDTSSSQIFAIYHSVASILDVDRTWALSRLIRGGEPAVPAIDRPRRQTIVEIDEEDHPTLECPPPSERRSG